MDQVGRTRVQVVMRPVRPFDSIQIRRIEALFLKFHSTVALKCSRLPYQNTIIRPSAVTSDFVIHLELREHLRIKSNAGRLELVLLPLSEPLPHLLMSRISADGSRPRFVPRP